MASKQQMLDKVAECLNKARSMYPNVNIPNVSVSFDLHGKCFGQIRYDDGHIRFNPEAMMKASEDALNSTVPHEVAHWVAWRVYRESGHGHTWASICRRLGGDGARTGNACTLTRAKRVRQYVYLNSRGVECHVGANRHTKLQTNANYVLTYRDSGVTIRASGYTGRMVVVS